MSRQLLLFDLDREAPATAPPLVDVDDDDEDDGADDGVWIRPLKDPARALRQQLIARARRPLPAHIETTPARQAIEHAGRLLIEHGDEARWALTSPDTAESMTADLRRRVDALLAQAGLQAVYNRDLFAIA